MFLKLVLAFRVLDYGRKLQIDHFYLLKENIERWLSRIWSLNIGKFHATHMRLQNPKLVADKRWAQTITISFNQILDPWRKHIPWSFQGLMCSLAYQLSLVLKRLDLGIVASHASQTLHTLMDRDQILLHNPFGTRISVIQVLRISSLTG